MKVHLLKVKVATKICVHKHLCRVAGENGQRGTSVQLLAVKVHKHGIDGVMGVDVVTVNKLYKKQELV